MDIAKDPEGLLTLMYDHEIAISQLYGVYASKFPDYEDFWAGLSKEEQRHARYINALQEKVSAGSEFIVAERFSTAAIDTSLKYIKNQIDKACDEGFELINAFSMALHLEEGMIENNYFEIFHGDSPQAVHILNLLADETREHFHKIKNALEHYKKG